MCRSVKVAEADTLSFGGLTTVTNYHLVKKSEHVVDSVFMHDKFSQGRGARATSMVVVTKNKVGGAVAGWGAGTGGWGGGCGVIGAGLGVQVRHAAVASEG